MKAVLLAGGLGTRMREETEFRPKPMVEVGGKPVLWHIMKILSAQGINEFVVLTGYKGEVIRRYFHEYEALNLDFTVQLGRPSSISYHGSHSESGLKVTVLDTGPNTLTGERILMAREHLQEESFLITYGDGLADINLSKLLAHHSSSGAALTISTAKPLSRFGVVETDSSGLVSKFVEKAAGSDQVNIGYMIAETEIFEFLSAGQSLEEEPMRALVAAGRLGGFLHEGFWQPMDTQRELIALNELWDTGTAPWVNW
jgi:glucose-1-phosphate cytidylyltransferase